MRRACGYPSVRAFPEFPEKVKALAAEDRCSRAASVPRLNDRDALKAARRTDCRIDIRGNGDIRLESVQAHLVGNLFGNFRIRSEQTLQSFDIEGDGSTRSCFPRAARKCSRTRSSDRGRYQRMHSECRCTRTSEFKECALRERTISIFKFKPFRIVDHSAPRISIRSTSAAADLTTLCDS